MAVRRAVTDFLRLGCSEEAQNGPVQKQIVSLGAGSDTTIFFLQKLGLFPVRYIELDFQKIISEKISRIKHSPLMDRLKSMPGNENSLVINSRTVGSRQIPLDLHSERYHAVPVDLRDLQCFERALQSSQFDLSLVFPSQSFSKFRVEEKKKTLKGSRQHPDALFV